MEITSDISDGDVFAAYPAAPIDSHTIVHYRARLERRLLIDRCDDCGRWHSPPRPMCPTCWSTAVTPTEVSGRGVIDLFTLLHTGPAAEGVDYTSGHLVGAVSVEEQPGLRIAAGILAADPMNVRIGMPAKLTWIARSGGGPIPAFRVQAEEVTTKS